MWKALKKVKVKPKASVNEIKIKILFQLNFFTKKFKEFKFKFNIVVFFWVKINYLSFKKFKFNSNYSSVGMKGPYMDIGPWVVLEDVK